MFFGQLTNLWTQLSSKLAAGLMSNRRVASKPASSIHSETYLDAAVEPGPRTEPYVPASNDRVSESSLHLSC